MPSTVNGIGTGHYGKKNKETRQGTCTQCGTKGDLSDYDTRHAICVLFIPIIPLGKRRIMSHCKACDRWLQMSWKDWNTGVEVMNQLIEEGIAGPTPDREKTLDALGMVYQLQSITTLYDNLDQLYAHYHDDEEIMAAVAAVMVMLYDFTNAHTYAVRAFELNQSDDNRELVGVIALNTDKLSEARAAFQFIITNSLDDKYEVVLALVEAYQTKGQHQEALDLLDALAESFPDRAQSKPTRRLEKISNKNLESGKAIIPKAPPEKIDGGTKFILAAIAVLFVVGFIGFSLWEGFKRNVYFINGLSAEYTIDINGDSYTLPAAGLVPIPLGDGNFTIHVENETLELPDVTLSIDTGFFTRLFTNDTYIINPDTCGIILWENIPYAEEVTERLNDRYESIVHFGSSQYFFEGIHFPFEEVPDEISLDSDAVVTMRKSLANYSNADYKEVISPLYDSVGSEGLSELFRLTMLVNPDDEDIFYYATSFLPPKDSVKLLTPHLDNHLDDVNFHRNYQETAKTVVEYETLINRYEGYLNASPNSPELMYLLGRITLDQDKANALYTKAFESTPPSEWAVYAFCYNLLSNAQYDEAQEFANQWRKTFPDHQGLAEVAETVAMATGNYPAVIEKFENNLTLGKNDQNFIAKGHFFPLLAYHKTGNENSMKDMLIWLSSFTDPAMKEFALPFYTQLNLQYKYIKSEGKNLNRLDEDESIRYTFEHDMILGNHVNGNKIVGGISWQSRVYQGFSAMLHGDQEQGRGYFKLAAELLNNDAHDLALFASALEGKVVDHSTLRNLPIPNEQKVPLLLAAAYMNPAEHVAYAQMADRLNISFQFPQYLIQSVLDGLLPEDEEELAEVDASNALPIAAPNVSEPAFTIEDVVK